jgi:hypothetical protein
MLDTAKAAGGLYLISPLVYNNVITFLKTLEVELKKPATKRFQANILTTLEAASETNAEIKAPSLSDTQPIAEIAEVTHTEEAVVESISEESLPDLNTEDSIKATEVDEPDAETQPEEQETDPSLPDLTLHDSNEDSLDKPEGNSYADLITQSESIKAALADNDDVEGNAENLTDDSDDDSISDEIILETPAYDIPSNIEPNNEQEDSSEDQDESVIENIDEYEDTVESNIDRKDIDWLTDDSDDFDTEPKHAEEVSASTPESVEKKPEKTSVAELDLDMISDDEYENLSTEIPLSDINDSPDGAGEFDPDTQLIGLVQKIIGEGKTAQITHNNYPLIRIFPDNGWFVFAEELDSYPGMYRDAATTFSIESAEEEIKDELFNGRLPQSLWKLIFTAALFGSDGRLFEHLHYGEKFQLMHPPYFGMVPHTAEHIAIAEHMVNNVGTIESIAEDLDVDIPTVIDFCNACDAIKLLHRDSDNTEDEDANIMQIDITEIEDTPTIEAEHPETEQTQSDNKPGLINSLWSSLTK